MELRTGDRLIANMSCGFPDFVTSGREYGVVYTSDTFGGNIVFRIVNDKGDEIMPISTSFTRKEVDDGIR